MSAWIQLGSVNNFDSLNLTSGADAPVLICVATGNPLPEVCLPVCPSVCQCTCARTCVCTCAFVCLSVFVCATVSVSVSLALPVKQKVV